MQSSTPKPHYTLPDAIAILAATTPPAPPPKKWTVAEANARIVELEGLLGAKHGLPIFNPLAAARRIEHLEGLVREVESGELTADAAAELSPRPGMKLRKQPAAPALASPARAATAPSAPVAPPFQPSGDALTDAVVKASGSHSLRSRNARAKRDRLFATAANLPAGSLSRAAVEANLAAAQADVNDCE